MSEHPAQVHFVISEAAIDSSVIRVGAQNLTVAGRTHAVDGVFRVPSSQTDAIRTCLTAPLQLTLDDGVPSVVFVYGNALGTHDALFTLIHERVRDAGIDSEAAAYWVSTSDSRVVAGSSSEPFATTGLQAIAGLGPCPTGSAVQYTMARNTDYLALGGLADAQSPQKSPRMMMAVYDALLHRTNGPTRFLVVHCDHDDVQVLCDILGQRRSGSRLITSGARILSEGFGGGWRGRLVLATHAVGRLDASVALAQAAQGIFSVLRKRSVNPSFQALLEAAKRELAALGANTDKGIMQAKLDFLQLRVDRFTAAATPHIATENDASSASTAASAGGTGLVSASPGTATTINPGSNLNETTLQRLEKLERALKRCEEERDIAEAACREAHARATRYEAAHLELLEQHRAACKHHGRVEERLRADLDTQVSRTRALEVELVAMHAVAAQRRHTSTEPRKHSGTTSPASRTPRSVSIQQPQPNDKALNDHGTQQENAPHVAAPVARGSAIEPSPAADDRNARRHDSPRAPLPIPPLARMSSQGPSGSGSRQPSPVARAPTPRVATPSTRSPVKSSSSVSVTVRGTRRAESPSEARAIVAKASFTKPTAAFVTRSKSATPRDAPPEVITRLHSENAAVPDAFTTAAVVSAHAVRPRIATPVRSDAVFRTSHFVTTYRPTRMVRHNEWESAADALQRDAAMRAAAAPLKPVISSRSAPPPSVIGSQSVRASGPGAAASEASATRM